MIFLVKYKNMELKKYWNNVPMWILQGDMHSTIKDMESPFGDHTVIPYRFYLCVVKWLDDIL